MFVRRVTAFLTPVSSRPQMATDAPSRTITSAMASPIPRVPPVTIAFCPSRKLSMLLTVFDSANGSPDRMQCQSLQKILDSVHHRCLPCTLRCFVDSGAWPPDSNLWTSEDVAPWPPRYHGCVEGRN